MYLANVSVSVISCVFVIDSAQNLTHGIERFLVYSVMISILVSNIWLSEKESMKNHSKKSAYFLLEQSIYLKVLVY